MSEPTVAPYGGLMTKTLDDEKEREAKLKEQQIEVEVDGLIEVVRPEVLHIRGVDSLSTEDIKAFIDYYVNFQVREEVAIQQQEDGTAVEEKRIVYEPYPIDDQVTFRIQWINDTSVNVIFPTLEECKRALYGILSEQEIPIEDISLKDNIKEKQAKSYTPILAFRRHQNLSARLGIEEPKEEEIAVMEEDESSIILYVRSAFQSDKKVKNAKLYSRYYLIHGEPERRRYERPERTERRGNVKSERGGRRKNRSRSQEQEEQPEEEDLFADRLKGRENGRTNHHEEEEEDLFADRLRNRERSPTRDRQMDLD